MVIIKRKEAARFVKIIMVCYNDEVISMNAKQLYETKVIHIDEGRMR